MDRAGREHLAATETSSAASTREDTVQQAIKLLIDSLMAAATTHRARYLVIFELRLEALRRLALAAALAELADASVGFAACHHAELSLSIPRGSIPTLITLYGGTLFTLVTTPPDRITDEAVYALAHAIVRGVLPERTDDAAPDGPSDT